MSKADLEIAYPGEPISARATVESTLYELRSMRTRADVLLSETQKIKREVEELETDSITDRDEVKTRC